MEKPSTHYGIFGEETGDTAKPRGGIRRGRGPKIDRSMVQSSGLCRHCQARIDFDSDGNGRLIAYDFHTRRRHPCDNP